MTISQLKAFVWIATLGSFRAAAERLRLTQPTISLRIQTLEKQLGRPLFERSASRVRLTDYGAVLLDYATRIVSLSEEATVRIGDRAASTKPLRIGAIDSFALTCMPEILRKLMADRPKGGIDITVGHTILLEQKLLDGQLDIAVLGDPIPNDHIINTPLSKMSMVWLTSPALRIHSKVVNPEDLANLQVLTMPADTRLYHMMQDWFGTTRHQPRRICTCSSLATIVALLESGCGVSLLPKFCVQDKLKLGTLKVLRVRPPVPHGLYTVAQKRSSPASDFDEIFLQIQSVARRRITS
jgi:DNA-binding transcriptional LysR family regulator